jgi:S-disulfanyl-L-cysteine oxidoreductase SoxD
LHDKRLLKGAAVLLLVAASGVGINAGYGGEAGAAPLATVGQTVWSGVYTAAQAERGQAVYVASCQLCHGESMHGGPGVPGIAGPEFKFKWDGKPAAELFEYLRTMMPPGQVGILNEQQYIDLMAEIFRNNDYPAGDSAELKPDPAQLAGVLITRAKP